MRFLAALILALLATPAAALSPAAIAVIAPAYQAPATGTWTPASLGSALKGRWLADDHGTARMTDDGSGLISKWDDAVSAISTTATTTARPTWTATAFNGVKSGVTCDGVANTLTNTSFAALPTGSTAGEIWVIAQKRGSFTGQVIMMRYGTGAATLRSMQQAGTGPLQPGINDGTTLHQDNGSAINDGQLLVMMGAWSGTTEEGRLNGRPFSNVPATIATLATGTTRLRICAAIAGTATAFGDFVIREIDVVTTLSFDDRQRMEGYAQADGLLWGLLPYNHPYRFRRP